MELFSDIQQAQRAIASFLITNGAGLPEDTRQHVLDAQTEPSPVDHIVKTLEALYAVNSKLDDAGKTLIGQLAAFATPLGWHGLRDDNRGLAIQLAMQRDTGEAAPARAPWPKADDDPVPKEAYLTPEPPSEPETEAETPIEPPAKA